MTHAGVSRFQLTDSGPDLFQLTDSGPDLFQLTDSGPDLFQLTDSGPDLFQLTDSGPGLFQLTDSGPGLFQLTDRVSFSDGLAYAVLARASMIMIGMERTIKNLVFRNITSSYELLSVTHWACYAGCSGGKLAD
ncbi:MAG: hypothetical protein JSW55_04400 [Chloroflexota bacterium]|nr:MAG: hypothetical protein JSW55_04400 [Chloroflexota bacterium]